MRAKQCEGCVRFGPRHAMSCKKPCSARSMQAESTGSAPRVCKKPPQLLKPERAGADARGMGPSWMRNVVGVAVGLVLCAGVTWLAIDLHQTQSRTRSDAQRSATERASLAGALIDSMFQNSSRNSAAAVLPVSRARVTPAEVRAITQAAPLGAVLGSEGKVLASWPPLSA